MNDFLKIKKPVQIAITGPESTGKSQLASELASHFGGSYVAEYAREYIDNLSVPYARKDLLIIARQQFINMEEGLKHGQGGFVFYDTELTVLRIWSEYKYGECAPWIVERQEMQNIDLYLLTETDLPWQPDPQREHPDKRQELFDLYKAELQRRAWDFEVVSGQGKNRLENAIRIIELRYKKLI